MSQTIQNSKPRLWFGLHMVEGLAEYRYSDREPERILVLENAIKEMDPSFQGCPVFVMHKDEVDVNQFLDQEPDGIVVRSFFNKSDGKHWCEFMTFTDESETRIKNGWVLSNAYKVKSPGPGGDWHGVSYEQEVMNGEYEHLAIVPNPRYKESVILTPEQFRTYNSEKEQAMLKIANSADDKGATPMFKWNKKSKVEDKIVNEMESMTVTLPKTKLERTITELVNGMDEYELKMKEPQMCNMEHMIEHSGKKMNLGEFVGQFDGMKNELDALKKKHDGAGEDDMMNESGGEPMDGDNESGEGMDNAEDDADKDKDKDKKDDKKENSTGKGSNIERLRNAPARADADKAERREAPPVMTNSDRVALGKKKYGSKA